MEGKDTKKFEEEKKQVELDLAKIEGEMKLAISNLQMELQELEVVL